MKGWLLTDRELEYWTCPCMVGFPDSVESIRRVDSFSWIDDRSLFMPYGPPIRVHGGCNKLSYNFSLIFKTRFEALALNEEVLASFMCKSCLY